MELQTRGEAANNQVTVRWSHTFTVANPLTRDEFIAFVQTVLSEAGPEISTQLLKELGQRKLLATESFVPGMGQ